MGREHRRRTTPRDPLAASLNTRANVLCTLAILGRSPHVAQHPAISRVEIRQPGNLARLFWRLAVPGRWQRCPAPATASSVLAVVQVRCVCDGRWDALCGLRGAGLLLADRGVCLQPGAADPCGEGWLSTLTFRVLRGATQILRCDS
ncbi:hypothetical protein E2C01_058613 [Portunus trituberculatus]|uniref:Uncharacterized protein n=1 Tax=Portunus trituberculatus TaxID=210409 RepID=A0A5B7H3N5_PORTR|nr:hypothetical protein [Portunus trituberculatus]